MTIPSWMHGKDPSRNLEALEVGTLKREKGCAACARRGEQVFGKWMCSIDKKPKPIYCQEWRLHEDYQ